MNSILDEIDEADLEGNVDEQEKTRMEHIERIRDSLTFQIHKMCTSMEKKTKKTFSKKFVHALSQVTLDYSFISGRDCESFSKHAKRKLIMPDDVLLLSRNNDSLKTALVHFMNNNDISNATKKSKKRKTKAIEVEEEEQQDEQEEKMIILSENEDIIDLSTKPKARTKTSKTTISNTASSTKKKKKRLKKITISPSHRSSSSPSPGPEDVLIEAKHKIVDKEFELELEEPPQEEEILESEELSFGDDIVLSDYERAAAVPKINRDIIIPNSDEDDFI